jgi:hypothetical protein
MRFHARFAILLAALLLLAGVLYAQTPAPTLPSPGPDAATASPLLPPDTPDQPNLTPGFGFEYRSCSSERTACFNSCPQSGPDKIPCFQACQCQYLMCIGAHCTE